jgi:hypothetical protein
LLVFQWQPKNFVLIKLPTLDLEVAFLEFWQSQISFSNPFSPPIVICIACESLGQQEELILGHSMSNQHIEDSLSTLPYLISMIYDSTSGKRQNKAQENMDPPYSDNQNISLVSRFAKVFRPLLLIIKLLNWELIPKLKIKMTK